MEARSRWTKLPRVTLSLQQVVVLAALQGLSEALPISRSGHEVVARIWLDRGSDEAIALEGALQLGTALAFLFVTRHRLAAILRDGLAGALRSSALHASAAAEDARFLGVAALVSFAIDRLIAGPLMPFLDAPAAAGFGLCLSGFALASTLYAPRPFPSSPGPSAAFLPARAALLGLAHGLAAFPGATRIGVVFTILVWSGVRAGRALDLAFLVTVPTLIAAFATGVTRGDGGSSAMIPGAVLALALVVTVASSAGASSVARALAERGRIGVLAFWILPLGLATLAYARALPSGRASVTIRRAATDTVDRCSRGPGSSGDPESLACSG